MANVDHQAYLRDRAFAQWVAQNRLAEAQLQRRIGRRVLAGSASGFEAMAGLRWAWRINAVDSGIDGLRRLEVEVGPTDAEPIYRSVGFVHE
jgi:type II secretion system protein I